MEIWNEEPTCFGRSSFRTGCKLFGDESVRDDVDIAGFSAWRRRQKLLEIAAEGRILAAIEGRKMER
jgi:hypothetical protein